MTPPPRSPSTRNDERKHAGVTAVDTATGGAAGEFFCASKRVKRGLTEVGEPRVVGGPYIKNREPGRDGQCACILLLFFFPLPRCPTAPSPPRRSPGTKAGESTAASPVAAPRRSTTAATVPPPTRLPRKENISDACATPSLPNAPRAAATRRCGYTSTYGLRGGCPMVANRCVDGLVGLAPGACGRP